MNPPIQMSQGIHLLQLKVSRAYPVPCDEWALLKSRLQKVSGSPFILHTLGSTLIGAGLATFLALITDAIPPGTQNINRVIGWSIVVVTGVLGALCLWFAHKQQELRKYQVADVVSQMELIEQRYQSTEDAPAAIAVAPADVITITEAKYGRGAAVSDVTAIVQRHIVHGRLKMTVENAILGDPCVGEQKQLTIKFSAHEKQQVVVVKEGSIVDLP